MLNIKTDQGRVLLQVLAELIEMQCPPRTGELGTGNFLRYERKSGLTGDFYFINEFLGFKKPPL